MSHRLLIAIAIAFSCQAYGAAPESASVQHQPAATTQQVKTASSTLAAADQAAKEKWEPKDIILAAGVVVTLFLGLWNAFANFRAGQRTMFVNTVTSQRIKWIEQLRQDISTFSGLVYHWAMTDLTDTKEKQQIVKEIDRLNHVIRLRLNPAGTHDKVIEAILAEIPKHTEDQTKIKELLEQLTVTSQALLKEEWEKVKVESKKGPLSDRA
jgi:hypothetical protein